ncbi:RNA-binding protein [Enemella dayhoffiae]|uniref:RNA-binding protein n=1 Tax=Enemella dayhoffiae TaxID=2016507 RepID=A0A255H594_9ACTN|nr:CGNR zinc finger domain-containing protein [Enemella dayhoffiae]OYO22787.1 RNA-binding protein [Enemella dayhoffiae]
MIFEHDVEVSLQAAADLINTAHEPDTLTTVEELADFVDRWRYSGVFAGTAEELDQVRRIRPRLEELWITDEFEAVRRTNDFLRRYRALPQLARHDGFDWHIHAARTDAPLADRLVVELAMAMVDVVRDKELSRLQRCAAEDCDNVLVDLSRNRSRRFCDAGCGNRANVAAYRARQRGEA